MYGMRHVGGKFVGVHRGMTEKRKDEAPRRIIFHRSHPSIVIITAFTLQTTQYAQRNPFIERQQRQHQQLNSMNQTD